MSCVYRIQENMHAYTETESRIAHYILEHQGKVTTLSSHLLAEAVGASAAAVIRFSKKLGYNGFSHLKVELAKSHDVIGFEDGISHLIVEEDGVASMIRKSEHGNAETFRKTYKLLDESQLNASIEACKKARRIYLLGIGGSSIPVYDLYQKFTRIDKPSIYYHDFHLILASLSHATPEDVLLVFSYSGMTKELIFAQSEAKKRNVTIIAVTQVGKTPVSKLSDIVIHIPREETELRLGSIASRFSMLAVSDLIYLGIAKDQIEETREKLIASREIVKSIQDY